MVAVGVDVVEFRFPAFNLEHAEGFLMAGRLPRKRHRGLDEAEREVDFEVGCLLRCALSEMPIPVHIGKSPLIRYVRSRTTCDVLFWTREDAIALMASTPL